MITLKPLLERYDYDSDSEGVMHVYHRSNDLDHMVKSRFFMSYADNTDAVFGKALYFAETPNIWDGLGKYLCKFAIKVREPILDLNEWMGREEADRLLVTYNRRFKTNFTFKWKKSELSKFQFGDFFWKIVALDPDQCSNFYTFIRGLGYNSFMHFTDEGTNFSKHKTEFGRVFGIYYGKDVQFLEVVKSPDKVVT